MGIELAKLARRQLLIRELSRGARDDLESGHDLPQQGHPARGSRSQDQGQR